MTMARPRAAASVAIALVDYGAGNVRSVHKALQAVGAEVVVARDAHAVLAAGKVVLPGVGAFGDCMSSLSRLGLVDAIRTVVGRGVPFLGICVGMQVLFEYGEELGGHSGLGLLAGRVVPFQIAPEFKVPHTGWNVIEPKVASPLLEGLPERPWTYFNHGFHCQARPSDTVATTDYGGHLAAVVGRDALWGVQFHPEKSQDSGLQVLRNFARYRLPAGSEHTALGEGKG